MSITGKMVNAETQPAAPVAPPDAVRPAPQWAARHKDELIIEVWEWLDCESIGAAELQAIADVVREHYGAGALDSPARTARLLADEGAELRHAEILELDVLWRTRDKYAPMLRNLLKFSTLAEAAHTLREMENLRQHFLAEDDQLGWARLRELAQTGRSRAQMIAGNVKVAETKRAEKEEIAEWFRIWLSAPDLFPDWLELRRATPAFKAQFAAPPARENNAAP